MSSTVTTDHSNNATTNTNTNSNNTSMIVCCGPYIVLSPPIKKQMISGLVVPTLRSVTAFSMLQQPKRQISIVVYTTTNTDSVTTVATDASTDDHNNNNNNNSTNQKKIKNTQISQLQDDDRVLVRICRLSSEIGNSPKNSTTDEDSTFGGGTTGSSSSSTGTWVEHKVYRLEEIQILKQRKDSMEVQLGLGHDTIVRDYKFIGSNDTADTTGSVAMVVVAEDSHVSHFCSMLLIMKQLEQRRAMKQLEQYRLLQLQQLPPTSSPSSLTTTTIGGIVAATASPTTSGTTHTKTSSTTSSSSSNKIQMLVEIVSATHVPIADITSTDAYIVVRFGSKEIHRTAVIHNNLSPIFTLFSGSFFTIQCTTEEFFHATSGLSFTIKDYDQVGSNDLIGTVHVTLQQLLSGTGQRTSYPIVTADPTITEDNTMDTSVNEAVPLLKKKDGVSRGSYTAIDKKKKPTLYLRYKTASQHDIDFIHEFMIRNGKGFKNTTAATLKMMTGGGGGSSSSGSNNICGVCASETFLSIRLQPLSHNILNRQEKKNQDKEMMYRVKPCPDPNRPIAETEWMTIKEIEHEVLQPSTYWIEAGNGNLGKAYIEIIGCDDLPNMDVGNISLKLPTKDKTDAFACIVFEDVIVNTDVIANEFSPRWMPWCHRAFALNILHPSSDVFIGIFDHDNEHNPLHMASQATSSLHDPIGRIVLNLSHFKPDTVYLLQYPLYFGELKQHRKATRGTLTVRLRLEFPTVRNVIMGGITPPPQSTVSVSRHIDFDVAHYTTDGIVDDSKFSLDTLSRYVEELQAYQKIVEYINEAFLVVWLWRGHFPVEVAGKTYKLPIHSMTAYTWAILVSWNWNRLPAFWAFSVAWILLATNEYQSQHPSRWRKCPTYYSLLESFARDASSSEYIQSNTNIDAINAYNDELAKKLQRQEEDQKKETEHEAALQQELGQEIEAAEAAEEVGRKRGGILTAFVPENPLKGVLFPVQKQAREIVFGLRIIKTVIIWKEAYYAFWVTTAALVASVVAFWIPWSFILRWLFRIIAIVALGPWMAIVDHKYFKTDPNLSDAERDKILTQKLRGRYEEVVLSATNYFQRKERALKLASMKKYMFGQYSVRVPQFCEDLFDDIPLPSSSCYPYDPSQHAPIKIQKVVYGQTLKGDMVPTRESEMAASVNIKPAPILSTTEKKGSKKLFPFFGNLKKNVGESVPLLANETPQGKKPSTYESIKKSS